MVWGQVIWNDITSSGEHFLPPLEELYRSFFFFFKLIPTQIAMVLTFSCLVQIMDYLKGLVNQVNQKDTSGLKRVNGVVSSCT